MFLAIKKKKKKRKHPRVQFGLNQQGESLTKENGGIK
jgi:hypothetical protein